MVDANILIQDVITTVQSESPSSVLRVASLTWARVFCSGVVAGEVVKRLPRLASRYEVPLEVALRCWRRDYRTRIWVVDVPSVPEFEPQLAHVTTVDPDDLSTGILGLLLAPAMVLSEDRDLTVPHLARREWRQFSRLAEALSVAEDAQAANDIMMAISVNSVFLTGQGVFKLLRAPKVEVRIATAAALVVLGALGWRNRDRLNKAPVWPWITRGLEAWGEVVGPALMRGEGARQAIQAAVVAPVASPPLLARVARLVALSKEPLAASEVAAALRDAGVAHGR